MWSTIKSDGTTSHEYVLLNGDDALVISENTDLILCNVIECYFDLNESPIGPPKLYLGGM